MEYITQSHLSPHALTLIHTQTAVLVVSGVWQMAHSQRGELSHIAEDERSQRADTVVT